MKNDCALYVISDFDHLSEFGERMFAMHLHDNHGNGDDAHAVPFRGAIDWAEKVAKLKKTKLWQNVITLESVVLADESLYDGLKCAYLAAVRLSNM